MAVDYLKTPAELEAWNKGYRAGQEEMRERAANLTASLRPSVRKPDAIVFDIAIDAYSNAIRSLPIEPQAKG